MSKNQRYPDFVIGGAPKSGTSSLYFWLAEHPDVCGSKLKETFFFVDKISRFNNRRNFKEHGLEAYGHFFESCDKNHLAFEATAHYLYENTAREQLNLLPTKPKIIFILREPAAQVYSHYRMIKFRTKTFKGSFEQYLQRSNATYQVEYAYYLKTWLETFGKERVKVLVFEDLMEGKEKVVKEVCEFLGIDGQFYEGFDFQHRNETVAIKSGWLHQTGLRFQPLIPHKLQKVLLPFYLRLNSGMLPSRNDKDTELLGSLKPLSQRIKGELQELLPELDLSYWSEK